PTWADLVSTAQIAAAYLGINKSLWEELKAEVGAPAAAVCVVIAERRITDPRNPVRSPGAFVRGMLKRAKDGQLKLHKSVFGLEKCTGTVQ
ncbi:replication initiation protein RepC, partial [Roseibium sp. RKSG952]|uniref:replication initiation protein RepC n=1 Tax=Roseibium sp. RKSG952 TaxID=2529384 RepID=UPI0013CB2721